MKADRRRVASALFAALTVPYASAQGSKRVDVGPFDALESRLACDLLVVRARSPGVVLDGEERAIQAIRARVDGRTLVLDAGSYQTQRPLKVSVGFTALRRVVLSGSGRCELKELPAGAFELVLDGTQEVVARGLNLKRLGVDSRGSDSAELAGRCEHLDLFLTGSGDVRGSGLQAATAVVNSKGSGDAELSVDRRLEIRLDGSGSVRYRGRPTLVRSGDGSGDVQAIR